MTQAEETTIRNLIARLDASSPDYRTGRASKEIAEFIEGPGRLYLQTWVCGPLQALLPESRNLRLAVSMSQ
jgi:hypothetical protein